MKKALLISLPILLLLISAVIIFYPSKENSDKVKEPVKIEKEIEKKDNPNGLDYNNKSLNFTLKFTDNWNKKYLIEEKEKFVKFTYDSETGDNKQIFTLHYIPKYEWETLNKDATLNDKLVTINDSLVYYYEVEISETYKDKEEQIEFDKMKNDVPNIIKSLSFKKNEENQTNEDIVITNKEYNYSFKLPIDWKDRYLENTFLNRTDIVHNGKGQQKMLLFSIRVADEKTWDKNEDKKLAKEIQITNGKVYYYILSDKEIAYEDKSDELEFKMMLVLVEDIMKTFQLK